VAGTTLRICFDRPPGARASHRREARRAALAGVEV
jgi:hypothetical protein